MRTRRHKRIHAFRDACIGERPLSRQLNSLTALFTHGAFCKRFQHFESAQVCTTAQETNSYQHYTKENDIISLIFTITSNKIFESPNFTRRSHTLRQCAGSSGYLDHTIIVLNYVIQNLISENRIAG